MSDEVVGTSIPGEEQVQSMQPAAAETSQPDVFEQKALSQGWKPKEEWDGDPALWRPAKEFVERGELFDTIHDLKSENKKIREALQFLTDHHKKVKDSEFQRALSVLKAEKKKALEGGDADRLMQVEDAIDLVKEQQAAQAREESEPKKQEAGPTPTFKEWKRDNGWYDSDTELREYADVIGLGYYQKNQGASETDVYAYVAKQVKKAFPEKFKGKAHGTPPVVEGSSPSRPSSPDKPVLSDDQKRVMKTFVRQGIMTEDEYVKELRRIGAI